MVKICANQTTGLYKLHIQPVGLLPGKSIIHTLLSVTEDLRG